MSHIDTSEGSTCILPPSKQLRDSCLASGSPPMPSCERSSRRPPSARLRYRCRPTIVSIADTFVRSLVIAGFCHKHSSRGTNNSVAFRPILEKDPCQRVNRLAGHKRSLSIKHADFYSRSPPQPISGQSSIPPRMYSTVAVPDMVGSIKKCCRDDSHFVEGEGSTVIDVDGYVPSLDNHIVPTERGRESSKERLNSLARRKNILLPEASQRGNHDHLFLATSRVEIFRHRQGPGHTKEEPKVVSESFSNATSIGANGRKAMDMIIKDLNGGMTTSNIASSRDTSHSEPENPLIERFLAALFDQSKSNQYVFRLYRELPSPGVAQLSKHSRGVLLRRFANPRDRRWTDARRYLALVEDMNEAGFPMSRSLWTSAIRFAGRATGRVFRSDLRRAIGVWHRMERFAGIKSDSVVFNILFDLAVKAGQYMVANRFMEEMKDRGIDFSRCGKVSMIFQSGIRKDVDGIRQAFNEFVNSGEIVDTVVLNCLLTSFLRAGKLDTAEKLYDRMMAAQKELEKQFPDGTEPMLYHPTLSSNFTVYRSRSKRLNRILKRSASLKDRSPEEHRALQSALPLTPDTRTFHILLSHHAHQTGDLYQFMAVLRDMEKTYSVPPRAMVFLFLFEGFANHGRRNKQWTSERLKDAWNSFRRALYDSKEKFNDRYYFRREKLGWENPLAKPTEARVEPTAGDIYMPLPSHSAKGIQCTGKGANSGNPDGGTEEEDEQEEEWNDDDDIGEDMGMLNNSSRNLASPHELNDIEQYVENGVFLGRKMIIAILRAFGACCKPKDVLDVWMQIERIWQSKKRKFSDVLAIKEELEKQLSQHRKA